MLVHGPDSSQIVSRAQRSGRGNSALWSVLTSYLRAYKEPQLSVYKGPWFDLDRSERVENHLASSLLRRPNPYLTMNQIKTVIRWMVLFDGNGYLIKQRFGKGTIGTNTSGALYALWPVSPMRMKPMVYDESDPRRPLSNGWIDYYAYDIGKGRPRQIPPENVMHFRFIPSESDPRMGLKTVREIVNEIATDTEAGLLLRAVLTNLGIPGLVVSPKEAAASIPADDRREMKASIQSRTSGSKRGEPMVFSKAVSLEQFNTNLGQYDLKHVWDHVETRIAGAIGWPAVLAGLGGRPERCQPRYGGRLARQRCRVRIDPGMDR